MVARREWRLHDLRPPTDASRRPALPARSARPLAPAPARLLAAGRVRPEPLLLASPWPAPDHCSPPRWWLLASALLARPAPKRRHKWRARAPPNAHAHV